MDAVSIAFGQAWRLHLDELEEAKRSMIEHVPQTKAPALINSK